MALSGRDTSHILLKICQGFISYEPHKGKCENMYLLKNCSDVKMAGAVMFPILRKFEIKRRNVKISRFVECHILRVYPNIYVLI